MTRGLAGNVDIVEALHGLDHCALKPLWHRLRFEAPCHDVDIILGEHIFKPIHLFLAPIRVVAIKETADHIIGLARASMPGAEFGAGLAGLESGDISHVGEVRHSKAARKTV